MNALFQHRTNQEFLAAAADAMTRGEILEAMNIIHNLMLNSHEADGRREVNAAYSQIADGLVKMQEGLRQLNAQGGVAQI